MSNIVSNFLVLKFFNIRDGRIVSFMDVIRRVSYAKWLKMNTNGATSGYRGLTSCIDNFRGGQR